MKQQATAKPRLRLVLASTLALSAMAEAGAAPAPCQVLPAEVWSSVMGYAARATPGDMVCTYEGKGGGGQFRIMAIARSAAEAAAGAKQLRDMQPPGEPNAGLVIVESQGSVVFAIALFQDAATPDTAAQLSKLVAAAKQRLPK